MSQIHGGQDVRLFMPGDHVRYVPYHAHGKLDHPDCEDGVVTSKNHTYVFVQFRAGSTSQACKPDQLRFNQPSSKTQAGHFYSPREETEVCFICGFRKSEHAPEHMPTAQTGAAEMSIEIDTGDSVKHGPTGETWLVAYVRGDRLAWCGWPEGEAMLEHCTLVRKATPEQRNKLLQEMADSSVGGARQRYAAHRLEQETSATKEPGV